MILIGGGAGALLRYVVSAAIASRIGARFPWFGTLVVNVTGCFLIGVLMTLLTERWQPHPNWRLLLVVGFLGGYTTFSTFEYETFRAAQDGARWMGLMNIIGSVTLGYIAVWIGVAIAAKH
jgi:CrcB protein